MTLKFDAQEFDALERVAEKIFRSGVCPPDVKNADAAFAVMLAGAEMGFGPMQSIRSISLVKGKVSLNADAQIAMCTRVRDVCEYFRLAESTAERATFVTHRKGHPAPVELTWTFEQAKAAGLTGSSTWRAHPGAMLRARCGAALARAVYPDLVAGVYDPDEAEEIRRDEPADQSRPRLAPPSAVNQPPAANDTGPLAAYRARIAAVATVDELVAVVLALAPTVAAHREAARAIAQARSAELGTGDLAPRVQIAAGITKDPAAWTVVAQVLGGLALATDRKAVGDVVRMQGVAVGKLPEALQVQLNAARTARLNALSDLAAGFEAELNAAGDIPTLEGIGDRIVDAFQAGRLSAEQAKALADLQDRLCSGMERAA